MTRQRGKSLALAALCAAILALAAVPAAATPAEEQQGRELVESLRAGDLSCSDLSPAQFELVGEYAMGRYFDDPGRHEAMNERMTAMMGSGGEERMHIALGRRYSGCGGGSAGWMGPMAAMMDGRGGMMGGGPYSGSMMGFGRGGHGGGGMGAVGVALIAMAAAALGAGLAVLLVRDRRSRPGTTPTPS